MNQETQFLEYVVKAMVDNPDAVKIVRSVDDMGVLLNLTVAPEDMGKIIGRKGNTAGAIRTLLRVVGMKNNARVNLKIPEPEGSLKNNADGSISSPVSSSMKSVDEALNDLDL
jgi:hypothetical protein